MKVFLFHLLWRVGALVLACLGFAFAVVLQQMIVIIASGLLLCIVIYSVQHYVVRTNRKLTRFFESIQYDDFNIKFQIDSKLGKSFDELNMQLNQILQAFREARAEKEATLHYLNNIVQHINVGIFAIDARGSVQLMNQAALRLLGIYNLKHIDELQAKHPELHQKLTRETSQENLLYEGSPEKQLLIRTSALTLQGKTIRLFSLQNIIDELQQKELEAWQNLTKILRHEIMNSVAPIVSLIGTMKDILEHDVQEKSPATEDLSEALETVESRGRGVMNFVNAYREFTNIPKPQMQEITVGKLIERVGKLFEAQAQAENVQFLTQVEQDFLLYADNDQLEQVLINLIKNAFEATEKTTDRKVSVRVYQAQNKHFIAIQDNGVGIETEAIEKIFMPFYSTKPKGSGIGLSLSYQIIRLHQGTIKVQSALHEGSTFSIIF
ncbi:MAG: GHKL domain-containing protein [Bacteroidetes bacterium]|nr:MAG: GHKL domain-containing protein [Bacteroidota bacterium]